MKKTAREKAPRERKIKKYILNGTTIAVIKNKNPNNNLDMAPRMAIV
jgi:hypothetical protein